MAKDDPGLARKQVLTKEDSAVLLQGGRKQSKPNAN